jgi:cullin-4
MRYEQFYKTKHKNHTLYWDHALGTAALKARFDTGEKELTVSLYQAIVLLLFNEVDELTYTDILEQTRMVVARANRPGGLSAGDGDWVPDEQELKRTLQSLACGKKRVLKKHPAGRDVGTKDVFRFNAEFTDPRYQVHINSIQVKETVSPLSITCCRALIGNVNDGIG